MKKFFIVNKDLIKNFSKNSNKYNIIQIQIILKYLFNVSAIHLLLLKQKYEISPLHSASLRFGRNDV